MNWQSFINKLEKDFRISSGELEERTGVHRSIYFKLKSGITHKPKQDTVRKLEEGLQIKIDDTDTENIFYVQNLNDANIELFTISGNEFPIISDLQPAVEILNPSNIIGKIALPFPQKNNCCSIQTRLADLDSALSVNDRILIDITAAPENGKLCVVRLCSGQLIVKYYRELPENLIQLYDSIKRDEPVTLKKDNIFAIYKVVLVIKYL